MILVDLLVCFPVTIVGRETGSDGRSSMGRTVGSTSTIDDVVKTGYKPTNLPISFTACTNEITIRVESTSEPPTEETTVEDNSTKCIKNPGGTLVIKRLNIPENCRNGSFRIRARFTSEYTAGIWCFVQSNPDAVNRIYLDTNIQNGYIDQTVTANNVQYLECGRSQSGNMPLCSTQFRIDCMPSAPTDEDKRYQSTRTSKVEEQ